MKSILSAASTNIFCRLMPRRELKKMANYELTDDPRFIGFSVMPLVANANYAWILHILSNVVEVIIVLPRVLHHRYFRHALVIKHEQKIRLRQRQKIARPYRRNFIHGLAALG